MPTKKVKAVKSKPATTVKARQVCPKCGSTKQKPAFDTGTKVKCQSCGNVWRPRV